jgi:hypothetical protein
MRITQKSKRPPVGEGIGKAGQDEGGAGKSGTGQAFTWACDWLLSSVAPRSTIFVLQSMWDGQSMRGPRWGAVGGSHAHVSSGVSASMVAFSLVASAASSS